MTNMSSYQQVDANSAMHNVLVTGNSSDPAVILLHGFPSNSSLWERQVTLADAATSVRGVDTNPQMGSYLCYHRFLAETLELVEVPKLNPWAHHRVCCARFLH